jgi:hypothetical protein
MAAKTIWLFVAFIDDPRTISQTIGLGMKLERKGDSSRSFCGCYIRRPRKEAISL